MTRWNAVEGGTSSSLCWWRFKCHHHGREKPCKPKSAPPIPLCSIKALHRQMTESDPCAALNKVGGFSALQQGGIYFPKTNAPAKRFLIPLESLLTGRAKWEQLRSERGFRGPVLCRGATLASHTCLFGGFCVAMGAGIFGPHVHFITPSVNWN